jgi:hypothetical protein
LIKFQELGFEQLIDLIVLLERLGFQDIEIGPEFLPDEL